MSALLRDILEFGSIGFLVYSILVNGFYTLQLVWAAVELSQRRGTAQLETFDWMFRTPGVPRVAVIVPAYNEETTVVGSVRSMLTLQYPDLQVVVVSDGSTDGTMDRLTEAFDLDAGQLAVSDRLPCAPIRRVWASRVDPRLVVVEKDNGGGKADAVNAGVNVTDADLLCVTDADTLLTPDSMLRLAQPFLDDDQVAATGGAISVLNDAEVSDGRVLRRRAPRAPIAAWQAVEYLRAFLFGRMGLNRMGGNLIVSGALGLFRRDVVIDVGGWKRSAIGEDMEMTVTLRRHGYETGAPSKVLFLVDPVAYTDAPERADQLAGQRSRWHHGLADVLWRHRDMFFRPRYGVVGSWLMPSYLVIELAAPVIEALGLLMIVAGATLGAINVPFAMALLAVTFGWGVLLSVGALLLDEARPGEHPSTRDQLRLLGWAVTEPFLYRPRTVWWRLRGLYRWVKGDSRWEQIDRTEAASS